MSRRRRSKIKKQHQRGYRTPVYGWGASASGSTGRRLKSPAPPPQVPAPPAQEVANHALPPDIVDELVNTDDNAKRIRTLVKYYFTLQEHLNSNVNGKRGRNALDPVRIQLLRDKYFRFTNTPAGMRDHEWEWVTSKIDEDTRNVRKMVKRARANHIQRKKLNWQNREINYLLDLISDRPADTARSTVHSCNVAKR